MTNKPQALDELLPCPFCGSTDVVCGASPKGICMPNGVCYDCGTRGPLPPRAPGERPNDAHEVEAVRLWNTRAAHSLIAAKVAELEEERDRLRGAISWIEPPFVDNRTPRDELFKRIQFCLADASRAALAPHPERHE